MFLEKNFKFCVEEFLKKIIFCYNNSANLFQNQSELVGNLIIQKLFYLYVFLILIYAYTMLCNNFIYNFHYSILIIQNQMS